MRVISVSKTYKHRGRNIKHRPDFILDFQLIDGWFTIQKKILP